MILTNDKKIWVPDGDTWARWSDTWELDEYNEVMQHIPKKSVALDIGAHVGLWSKRLVKEFEHVHCFEPIKKHIECWHKNLTNDFNNVDIYNVALSHFEGTSKMKVPVKNSGMASLHYTHLNAAVVEATEEDVEVRTLDSYDFDVVDFMKIDVEGHENKVLRGAQKTIEKHKPVLYIEIVDIKATQFLADLNIGYKLIYAAGSNRLFKSNTVLEELKEILKQDYAKGPQNLKK